MVRRSGVRTSGDGDPGGAGMVRELDVGGSGFLEQGRSDAGIPLGLRHPAETPTAGWDRNVEIGTLAHHHQLLAGLTAAPKLPVYCAGLRFGVPWVSCRVVRHLYKLLAAYYRDISRWTSTSSWRRRRMGPRFALAGGT
jgi:hypothetical protein